MSVGLWVSPAIATPPVGEFVKDVSLVAGPGSPGTVVALSPRAVPVVVGQVENGAARAPVVVASKWDRGRVVALAHSGYLDRGVLTQGQTALLLERLVRWAAGTREGRAPRIAAVDGSLGEHLRGKGFEVVQLADLGPESLARVDCVLLGGRDLSQAEIDSLGAFVRAGGGLVAAQTGWGWQQIAARGGPSPDMRTNALNRLLRPAGIGWTDEIADETAPDGFDLGKVPAPEGPAMNLEGALDALLSADAKSGERSPQLRQASATATRGIRLLPADDETVRPRLRAMMDQHGKDLVPTEKAPLKSDRPLLRMLLAVQLDELSSLPAERVRAHPASESFPGAVKADAPRVTRTMTLPATNGGWQSTGLYAAAGEVVTITRPEAPRGRAWTVRIGVHTDTLWHLPQWKRAPEIVRAWSVPAGATKIASAFGGLISIERPRGGPVEVTIEGAVEAPRFVLGTTTREQWEALRRAPAPWGEIETPSVIVSAPASALRAIDDPTEIAELWQSVLDHAADLRAIPRQRPRGERYVPDVQISAGYMHSGYPIMTHLDVVDDLTQAAKLRAGSWGLFHELGHNHQDGLWTFDGTVEVTCNLWSLYLMEKIAGKPIGTGHDALEPREQREKRMRKHLGTGAKFERWKADPFLALEMYIQIREDFGWEPFKKVFAEYDALAAKDRPRTDVEKHEQWMVRMSRATGRNLGPFFERWGVPTGEAARASIADLPEWMPAGMPERAAD